MLIGGRLGAGALRGRGLTLSSLMFLSIWSFADAIGHIVVAFQNMALLRKPNKCPEVVGS
jgi:hypothetical protein